MKTEKEFDCVRMKDEIQQKLQSQWEGLTGSELVARIKKDIDESDSSIAQWWRRVEKQQSTSTRKVTVGN